MEQKRNYPKEVLIAYQKVLESMHIGDSPSDQFKILQELYDSIIHMKHNFEKEEYAKFLRELNGIVARL